MIVTVYNPDGTKIREAVGYTGNDCHKATAPYEVREAPGSVKKTATADAKKAKKPSIQIKKKGKA